MAAYTYKTVVAKLRRAGFAFDRNAAGTLRAIIREAGLTPQEFAEL
jgi:hypothetical protein